MTGLPGIVLGILGYLVSWDPWDSMPGTTSLIPRLLPPFCAWGRAWVRGYGATSQDYPGYSEIFRPGKLDLLFASATYSICTGVRLFSSHTDHCTRGSCVFTDIPWYLQYFGRKVYYAQL